MRFSARVGVGCLLVAGSVAASGAPQTHTWTWTKGVPPSNVHWISLPFDYHTSDCGLGASGSFWGVLDAQDLGCALGGRSVVSMLFRYHPTTGALDAYENSSSDSGPLWALTPGVGYGIQLSTAAPSTINATLSGYHADSYSKTYTPGVPPSNVHWFAVPYHFLAADCGAGAIGPWSGVIDSEDFACQLGGAAKISAVFRYHPITGALDMWSAGSTSSGSLFPIEEGAAVAIQSKPGQSVTYAPLHQ
jgi:hypothetical protein